MWCDFVVRTDSKVNNIFVERINFDVELFKEVLQKLKVFFEQGIIPELKSREIQSIVRVRVVQKILEDMVHRVADSLFVKITHVVHANNLVRQVLIAFVVMSMSKDSTLNVLD